MYTVLLVDDEDDVTQIIMKKVPAKLRIIAETPGRKLQQERQKRPVPQQYRILMLQIIR